MRRRSLAIALVAVVLAWEPLLHPFGQGAIVVGALYGPTLVGTDPSRWITPEPRVSDTEERFDGVTLRVTWWRPAWGDRHPALLVVNGATPVGNDDYVTRRFCEALARAGYLAMLPEFPFLKLGRFESNATRQIDAAFARLRAEPDAQGQ